VRRGHREFSSVKAGAIALAAIAVVTYFGFTKAIPFRQHFEIKAAFKDVNDLKPSSPVRIAGVKVGEVTEVDGIAGGRGAIVTMRLDDREIDVREDARVAVRPRIFLEGNYFLDVSPGTPSAPALEEGETIPVNQTSAPVQFGELLTALQSDTREDLKIVLQEYGRGVSGRGGLGFNRSIRYWEPAFRDSALVNQSMLGVLEHDLSGYVRGAGAVAEALDRDPEALKALITDFATTAQALASESGNLTAAIAELPRTLTTGRRALGSLNDSFPAFRRFVAAMRPATRSARPALDAALPYVTQARRLVSRRELGGLVSELRPTVPDLVELNVGGVPFQRQVRLLSSCQNNVVLPWTNMRVPDQKFPATGPVYQTGVKWLPGIAGESRSFDANGQYVRSLAQTGNFAYATGDGRQFLTTEPIAGVQPPKSLTGRPPIRPDVPCETQEPPDLRTRVQPPPPAQKVNHDSPAARARYLADRKRLRQTIEDQARQLDTKITLTGLPGGDLVALPKPAEGGADR
jgi:virulence factor Mce-like protein